MKIGAIIVLYNPSTLQINNVLQTLLPQVSKVCFVDNSEQATSIPSGDSRIEYHALHHNTGIAAAQNTGVRSLLDQGFDYLLFCDQDSIATDGLVEKLVSAYATLRSEKRKIGGLGTRAINMQTHKRYASKSKEYEQTTLTAQAGTLTATRCSYIRSSISLVEASLFREIGGYDASLFIDGVDNEWCWRAAQQGYQFFIVEEATIEHQLGEGDRKLLSKDIAISSAFRSYFQFRNYLWLCRRKYVPAWWKRRHLFKYMAKSFYYPLFVAPRGRYASAIFRGCVDGLFKSNKADTSF